MHPGGSARPSPARRLGIGQGCFRAFRSWATSLRGGPLLLFWHLLALLPRFGESDRDGLFPALHLSAFSALATLCLPALVAVHLTLDLRARSSRIFALPLLRHLILVIQLLAFKPQKWCQIL